MTDAKQIIRDSIAEVSTSRAPDYARPFVAGEINLAFKLGLIRAEERDHLMGNLVAACSRRRNELHRAKLTRLGIKE